jgi:glutathione synthase/RimK-type ligase-like ATP-grasp enzyme
VVVAKTVRCERSALEGMRETSDLSRLLPGEAFPIIVRPVGTHAGAGLSKLDGLEELRSYLQERREEEFYLAPFIDYRSPDGLFRKQRIAFIGGKAFISHMAISDHWMVHYLSAGMEESNDKRAEEAHFFEQFDSEFAVRHRAAFESLHRRIGLDYFGIDCAELPDGRLLVFEVDVAMIVHSLDPEHLYPYKRPAMARLFAGFQASLEAAAAQS